MDVTADFMSFNSVLVFSIQESIMKDLAIKPRLQLKAPPLTLIALVPSFIIQFQNNFTQVLGMTIPCTRLTGKCLC